MATGRIVSGFPAQPNQFPYQVGLKIVSPSGSTSVCGGSLISAAWVLTAAHCTVNTHYQYNMRIGSIHLGTGGISQTSNEVVSHPSYNPSNFNNDVSLLRIPSPVTFSAAIQAVRLPSAAQSSYTFNGQEATIAGWGAVSTGGGVQQNLRYTFVRVITNAVCAQTYASERVIPSVLCTTGVSNQGACESDSGSALVIDEAGVPTQIAIVSFMADNRFGGCTSRLPTGYTRTSHHLGWIYQITNLAIR